MRFRGVRLLESEKHRLEGSRGEPLPLPFEQADGGSARISDATSRTASSRLSTRAVMETTFPISSKRPCFTNVSFQTITSTLPERSSKTTIANGFESFFVNFFSTLVSAPATCTVALSSASPRALIGTYFPLSSSAPVLVQRVAGHVKAKQFLLERQLLRLRPGATSIAVRRGGGAATKVSKSAACPLALSRCEEAEAASVESMSAASRARSVPGPVERAAFDEAFDDFLVHLAGVEPARRNLPAI